MSQDSSDEFKKREEMRQKVLTICEAVISKVYGWTVNDTRDLTPAQMKNMMFVVRESWYLANDRFGEMTPEEFEKLQAMADGDDELLIDGDDDAEEEEDTEDDDPFGLNNG